MISRRLYGHFAEHLGRYIYGGIYVGEESPIPNTNGMRNDVVAALRDLNLPNLRWPGGCFADEYHWMDGIGDKAARPTMINTHWGGVTEDNSFGAHDFFELCDQLGYEPYICGNVGSGTVDEPVRVQPVGFTGAQLAGDQLTIQLPIQSLPPRSIKPAFFNSAINSRTFLGTQE